MTTTANMTHSPLPWIVEGRCIYASDNTGVATCIDGRDTSSIDAHNAQLIVSAVNSHQALVEALQELLDQIENGIPFNGSKSDMERNSIVVARAALALAKGGKASV